MYIYMYLYIHALRFHLRTLTGIAIVRNLNVLHVRGFFTIVILVISSNEKAEEFLLSHDLE